MIANAGRFDPRVVPALLRRWRAEKWAAELIADIRNGSSQVSADKPAAVVAAFRDEREALLDGNVAAVELLNLLRPIVAVSRYIVFSAIALAHNRPWCERFEEEDWSILESFAEEVRRVYPFFPFVGGRAIRDFERDGHQFSKGDWMLLDLYGTNRDPARFPNPSAFNPERRVSWMEQGFDFIPQGAGRAEITHRCPGEGVTVELMKAAIRLLVRGRARVQDARVDLSHTEYPPMPRGGLKVILN